MSATEQHSETADTATATAAIAATTDNMSTTQQCDSAQHSGCALSSDSSDLSAYTDLLTDPVALSTHLPALRIALLHKHIQLYAAHLDKFYRHYNVATPYDMSRYGYVPRHYRDFASESPSPSPGSSGSGSDRSASPCASPAPAQMSVQLPSPASPSAVSISDVHISQNSCMSLDSALSPTATSLSPTIASMPHTPANSNDSTVTGPTAPLTPSFFVRLKQKVSRWIKRVKDKGDQPQVDLHQQQANEQEQTINAQQVQADVLAREQQLKVEQRTETALTALLPMFPHVEFDQALQVLEIYSDDVERSVEYLLNHSTHALQSEYAQFRANQDAEAARKERFNAVKHAFETGTSFRPEYNSSTPSPAYSPDSLPPSDLSFPLKSPSLYKQHSLAEKCVVFRVADVCERGIVTLQCCLDRHRNPIDTEKTSPISIPIRHLLRLQPKVCSAAETLQIEHDIATRSATLVYQVEDGYICPVQSYPSIRLLNSDYKIDFESETVTNISHVTDGPIKYTAVRDDGSNPLLLTQTIDVFTTAVDAATHNIVHMHFHDVSEEVTVDSINITNTALTLEDVSAAVLRQYKDVTGRNLCYKLVVKDGAIVAILSPVGSDGEVTVQLLKFDEHRVPAVGSLVDVSGQLCRVISVPTGMIVQNSAVCDDALPQHDTCTSLTASNSVINAQPTGSVHACRDRHAADMPGHIQVQLLIDNPDTAAGGSATVSRNRTLHVCVCRLSEPTAAQLEAYQRQQLQAVQTQQDHIAALIQELQHELQQNPSTISLDALQNKRDTLMSALQQPELSVSFVTSMQPALSSINTQLGRLQRSSALSRRMSS